MAQYAVRIPCDELELEGRLHVPEPMDAPLAGVVVCHPHPQYGGDLNNNVVVEITRALLAADLAVLRFNFRGVGASTGSYGGGVGERDDALAAVRYLLSNGFASIPAVGLAGYSFGGGVALAAALQAEKLSALAVVSALGDVSGGTSYAGLTMPKLIVTGDLDSYATAEGLDGFRVLLPDPVETRVYPRTDHFWWGSEEEMANQVANFFTRAFVRL